MKFNRLSILFCSLTFAASLMHAEPYATIEKIKNSALYLAQRFTENTEDANRNFLSDIKNKIDTETYVFSPDKNKLVTSQELVEQINEVNNTPTAPWATDIYKSIAQAANSGSYLKNVDEEGIDNGEEYRKKIRQFINMLINPQDTTTTTFNYKHLAFYGAGICAIVAGTYALCKIVQKLYAKYQEKQKTVCYITE